VKTATEAVAVPTAHSRKGHFVKVGENLYRYTASKTYYAVFRTHGKLRWKSLETADREIASRKLRDQLGKRTQVQPSQTQMTLLELVDLYEQSLEQYDLLTRKNRKYLVQTFKRTLGPRFGRPG
jgi:hypothetical protein